MPRIGLLSDSHGRAAITLAAAKLLVAQSAQMLLHLGDVGSIQVIDALAGMTDPDGRAIPSRLVFGNTDGDLPSMARYAQGIDVQVDHPVGRLVLDPENPQAGQLVFTHGDDPKILDDALAQKVRYLCHGHTHRASDQRLGETRIINPGALFRAREYTVALVDTQNDNLTFYPVGGA